MFSFRTISQACLYCESHFEIAHGEVLCSFCSDEWRKKPVRTVYLDEFPSRSLIEWNRERSSVGNMIKRLKQEGESQKNRTSRFRFMATKFWTQYYALEKFSSRDVVFIPAPARFQQEDDHASLFAKELSRLFGSPTRKPLRRVSQAEQKGMSRDERALNRLVLREGIDLPSEIGLAESLAAKKIVFVDDLLVSGQTARAAYLALGKPDNFEAWTIAYRPLFLASAIAKTRTS